MKSAFDSTILRLGASLLACCLLAMSPPLRAQEGGAVSVFIADGRGGDFGMNINGADIGTILLRNCDLDKDGKVALSELKEVSAACFKLWDTDTNGVVSASELMAGLKQLFPAPPPGGVHGVRVINGVAVEVSPDEMLTPDVQVAKRILAGADSNKDGVLTYSEVSAFLLDTCFKQWDQDGNGSLDAHELNVAFGQLARPD